MKSSNVFSHVLNAAHTLFMPSQVVELRAIFRNGRVDSGYFDDYSILAEAVAKLDERADVSGVYWTLNPVNPDCLHRAKNRLREWASKSKGGATTSDVEILERRIILLDFDGADRPVGISAMQEEIGAAKKKALNVAKFLAKYKWGIPIVAMSGNGYHLLYRTKLPNDRKSSALIKKFLASLALLFDDERIKIDASVFNASRIGKVYGTITRKGDDTPERPHRRSMLLNLSEKEQSRVLVTPEQIEAVAALVPDEPPKKPGRPVKNPESFIDVPLWVREHLGHIFITREKDYKGGKLYVLSECPFNPQHKAPDSAIGQYSYGAVFFKCFHNSCQEYDWQALREKFEPKSDYTSCEKEAHRTFPRSTHDMPVSETAELPTIELGSGQLRDYTGVVINAIASFGKNSTADVINHLLYNRGGKLVRIVSDSDGRLKLNIVTVEAMPEIMSRAANFVRRSASGYMGVFPPDILAKSIVNRGYWSFPILRGLVEIPVFRKDGSILDKPGYDPVSELYYHPNGPVPKIPDKPGRKDAENAAVFLIDVLSDFPFQDEASRDNAVGLLLTVVVKEIVGLAPISLIDAPTKGTGKTRLAQLASIIASGHELPLSPEVRDEEEWRKQITSLLIADRPVVIIDNVERTFCSGQLSAVLTTSEWSDRLLGRSEVLHLHSRAIWIATGNNIRLGGDIARRSYWIRLNSNLARPWMRDSREFKRELPVWAVKHRGEIIAALLTMARAWFIDGKRPWTGQPLGSYEAWSRTIGGILEYCGLKNFLSNLEELYEQADDEPAQWRVFFGAVFEVFGENNSFSTKTLLERISEESGSFYDRGGNPENNSLKSAVPECLGDSQDKGFSRRLGLAMQKRRDQLFETGEGFIQLKKATPDRHRQKPQWKLICIKNAPSASFAPSIATPLYSEKIIPETRQGNENTIIYSSNEGAAEEGAHGALSTENGLFVFEDDPEERVVIQEESQKDGGAQDGKTETE